MPRDKIYGDNPLAGTDFRKGRLQLEDYRKKRAEAMRRKAQSKPPVRTAPKPPKHPTPPKQPPANSQTRPRAVKPKGTIRIKKADSLNFKVDKAYGG